MYMPSKQTLSKKAIGIAIVLILILIAIFIFLNISPPAMTIVSDDGNAVLEIPKGALPDGVSEKDISIVAVEQEFTSEIAEGDAASSKAYELKPDGLVLNKAATIRIKDTYIEDSVALMIHVSKDGIEPFENARKELDKDGQLVYIGELSHFSRAVIFGFRMFGMVMDPPGENHYVGNKFIVRVQIQQLGTGYTTTSIRGKVKGWELVEDEPLLIKGGHFTAEGPLSPQELEVPIGEQEIDKTLYRIDQEFSCNEVGPVTITYEAELNFTMVMTIEELGRIPVESSKAEYFHHLYIAPWAKEFVAIEISEGLGGLAKEVSYSFNCIPAPDLSEFREISPGGIIMDSRTGITEFIPFK